MSEDVGMYRELVEELFPSAELSDEEVVRIGLAYVQGYRDGYKSVDPPPEVSSTNPRTIKTRRGA